MKTKLFNKKHLIVLTTAIWTFCVLYASFVVPPLPDPNEGHISKIRQAIFRFGFNQLHLTPALAIIIWVIFTLVLLFLIKQKSQKFNSLIKKAEDFIFKDWKSKLLVSFLFGILFWLLRSNYANKDFLLFKQWYPEHIILNTVHVRFDEMWESYLHLEFYKFFGPLFDWSLETTFQFFSCLCGFIFIFILLNLCKAVFSKNRLFAFIMLLAGGYVQLFFGDMESYTLCGMLVFLYFLTAFFYIQNKVSLVIPSITLMAAMTSHMASHFSHSIITLSIYH